MPPPLHLPTAHPARWRRRFALLSLLSVFVTAITSAALLSHGMASRMLQNHAELSQAYVDSLLQTRDGHDYFTGLRLSTTAAPSPSMLAEDIDHPFAGLSKLQGLLHANIYDTNRRIIWSTNRKAVGKIPGDNPELDEALRGEVAIESTLLEAANFIKPEHAFIPLAGRDAIETYVPMRDPDGHIVGATELYQSPQSLINAVHAMTRSIWLACAGSGLFIFLALYGLAWQADRQIADQQRRLVANESLAAVGDMASAVAHGIRNPLATIRSSAELMATDPAIAPASQDIMDEVDRLQVWVRQLLAYAQQGGRSLGPVSVTRLLDHQLFEHHGRIQRQNISVYRTGPDQLPTINADAPALEQAIGSLIGNALDAMPQGGSLTLDARIDGSTMRIEVADDGPGMDAQTLAQAFAPFHTTKRTGLGVGLSLVKRTVDRLGGQVRLISAPGRGTQALMNLPLTPNADRKSDQTTQARRPPR